MPIDRLTCTRCGHTWWPRTETPPRHCPRCNSPYWAKARKLAWPADRMAARVVVELVCDPRDGIILDDMGNHVREEDYRTKERVTRPGRRSRHPQQ